MTRTPYDSYIRASALHSLQETLTRTEGEMPFLLTCQIQELYYNLIGHELKVASSHLFKDAVADATDALRRVADHFTGLNASWHSLARMTVRDFLPIKEAMTVNLGKSSSLQSWKYRELVYLLGIKDAELAEPIASMTAEYEKLLETLRAPSVYDASLGVLHRSGLAIPGDVIERDTSVRHQPRPEIEVAWGHVYGEDRYREQRALGDALFAVGDGYATYKHLHLLATRRAFGMRPGYYGKSGSEWLSATVQELPFPELWSLRLPEADC